MPATYHVACACQQKASLCMVWHPPPPTSPWVQCRAAFPRHRRPRQPSLCCFSWFSPWCVCAESALQRDLRIAGRGKLRTAPLATPICCSEALQSPTAKDAGVPPEPGCSRHAASLARAHHPRCGSYCSQLQAVCMQSRGSCWADMISMRHRRCSWVAAQARFGTTGHTGGGQVCVHRQPFTGYCGRKG